MAQQCEDEGPATDISRRGRQGERPDKVAPGQISIKHQIKDLDRAHHNMGGIRQGDKRVMRIITTILAAPATGNIQTMVATSQPEIIALANISVGLFFITSSAMLTKA